MSATSPADRRLTAGLVETIQAKDALARLSDAGPQQWAGDAGGQSVVLGRELSGILTQIIEILASGGSVTIGAMPLVLTTTNAAKLLGVSRTTLMKSVASGALPSHKVGTHTRLNSADVQEFRRQRLERQRAAFEALMALEDALEDEASGSV